MSEDISDSIDRGDIKLVTNSNGDIFAQIRGDKGQFGERLPIKKELNEHGISADMVQMAMQMEAIKSQLERIVESLRTIEESVADVIQGQFNDRVGLYFSGLSTYLEARTIKDKGLKQQLIAQALKTLNDANAQMIQEIRTDIEYLISKRYNRSKDKLNKINERLTTIHKCYEVVYRASFLKTMIYQQEGEFASMLATLDEYGRFIEKLIVPNAGKLSELDKNVRMIDTGTWGKIAKTFISCKDLKRQLSDADTFYLTKSKENNDD